MPTRKQTARTVKNGLKTLGVAEALRERLAYKLLDVEWGDVQQINKILAMRAVADEVHGMINSMLSEVESGGTSSPD
jgi:hypothetical protein